MIFVGEQFQAVEYKAFNEFLRVEFSFQHANFSEDLVKVSYRLASTFAFNKSTRHTATQTPVKYG